MSADDVLEAPIASLSALEKCREALTEANLGGVVVCFDETGRVMSYTNLQSDMVLRVLVSSLNECVDGHIGTDSPHGIRAKGGEKITEKAGN